MKRKRFTEEQIAYALRQVESGTPVAEVCRKLGVTEQSFYRWKKKYGGMGVAELRRLKQLEQENRKLKQIVADLIFDLARGIEHHGAREVAEQHANDHHGKQQCTLEREFFAGDSVDCGLDHTAGQHRNGDESADVTQRGDGPEGVVARIAQDVGRQASQGVSYRPVSRLNHRGRTHRPSQPASRPRSMPTHHAASAKK